MTEYLGKIYQQMGQKLIVEESYFECDSRFYNIEKFLRSLPSGKLLDMGCGQGSVLHRVRDYHDAYGLEFDEGARTIALQRGLRCEHIDLNTAADIPYDQCFDYIMISEVCEHLLDPRNAFKVAFKRIKEGGGIFSDRSQLRSAVRQSKSHFGAHYSLDSLSLGRH